MPLHLFSRSRPRSLHHACRLALGLVAMALTTAGMAEAQQDFGQAPQAMNAYPPAQGNAYPPTPGNAVATPPGNAYPSSHGGYPNASSSGMAPSNAYPANGMGMNGNTYPAGNMPAASMQGGYPAGSGLSSQGQSALQGNPLQQLVQAELQDYGVPPQQTLQTHLHGPTPTRIPGGETITTDRVIALVQQNMQGQQAALVFHVLGPGPRLPGAENAGPASQAGSFDDATQQEFGRYLQQVSGGDKAKPMLFYCLNTQCWMSYNAALRAIAMGYSRVYWYRGGIEAWQQAESLAMSMQPQAPPPMSSQPQATPAGYR